MSIILISLLPGTTSPLGTHFLAQVPHARARSLTHTHLLLPHFSCCSSFFQRVFTFPICLLFLFIFCMNSISQIGFHCEKCSCFFLFWDDSLRTLQKLFVCLQKCLFSLHRFRFVLPFYFIKQTARCTKFGLVATTTTHF